MYFLLYVDDMLIAAKSMVEINKVKTQLSGEFEMKDLGAAKKILACGNVIGISSPKFFFSMKARDGKCCSKFCLIP